MPRTGRTQAFDDRRDPVLTERPVSAGVTATARAWVLDSVREPERLVSSTSSSLSRVTANRPIWNTVIGQISDPKVGAAEYLL